MALNSKNARNSNFSGYLTNYFGNIDNYNIKSIALNYLDNCDEKNIDKSLNLSFDDFSLTRKESVSSLTDNFKMKMQPLPEKPVLIDIILIASKIYDIFISGDSVYSVNITNKTFKSVSNKINSLAGSALKSHQSIKEFYNDNDVENIFDDAYEEVIRNIFYNSYVKFMSIKKDETNTNIDHNYAEFQINSA